MKSGSLRATETEFSRHVVAHSRSLATAADLAQHQFNLVATEEVAAEGNLQVRVQASERAFPAINQRGVRENTHQIWREPQSGDSLFFGYSESWQTDGRHRRLGTASIRFFYRSGLDDASDSPIQLFRFEWADAKRVAGTSDFVFPAKGAATPHWHYDGLRAERSAAQLLVLRELLEKSTDPTAESVVPDFDPKHAGASAQVRPLAAWFGSIHFPVRANWHEYPILTLDFLTIDPNPHAHSPKDVLQLQNAMCSALMYVRHQLSAYSQ